jgi:DNA-binding beta-propeller fold protein YncE
MKENLGPGDFSYETIGEWGKLPDGWSLGDVGAIGVDRHDNVYVFNRSSHPMIVFDRKGNFLRSWGEGIFRNPHGVHMGPDDTIYCTDDGDHTVRKCTLDGKVLLELGVPGQPSAYMSGQPFCRCTHTALSPEGDIYVCDGYGNARVHKYSPDGKLLFSWGEPGTRPGQFNIPHNICCDADDNVYVADRENHRIQVFDGKGRYQGQWNNLHRPCALCMQGTRQPVFYVGELAPQLAINRSVPNLGPRISILDHKGTLLAQLGGETAGLGPGQFLSPHGIAVDSHGDIYVGETSHAAWPRLFPDQQPPDPLRSLRKLVRLS